MQVLLQYGVLNQSTTNLLAKNYCFLRRIEHFLQVYDDKQLHSIPAQDYTVMKRISWLIMQEKDEDSFIRQLRKVKTQTHAFYKKVMNL